MRIIFCLLLLISINGFSQWKDFILSVKGDTLNRVDLKGKKQGPWAIKVPELRGERGYEEEGFFENDLKIGEWRRYSLEGIKIAEENYQWGKVSGNCKYFTYNGGLLREEGWRAIDPTRKYDTVPVYAIDDPNKIISMAVVKNEGVSVKHGTWNYYDPKEGVIVKTERYQLNKLLADNGEVIEDDLKPIGISNNRRLPSDTTGSKAMAKPQAILDYEKKNSGKKKVRTRDGSTGH